jgi:general L-amino acid transport system substrate-binding protein
MTGNNLSKRLLGLVGGCVMAFAGISQAAEAQTLEKVKARGTLNCGTSEGVPGFSAPDSAGKWFGFDIEYCKAIAIAILNDPTKISLFPLSSKDRFTALQSSEVDVLPRTVTWMFSRDVQLGLDFTAINYYDGSGFMVPSSSGVKDAKELNGASICNPTGTTTELAVADFFRSNNLQYSPVTFTTFDEAVKAYEAGRCDAFASDISQLYSHRAKLTDPNQHAVLPNVISKEPLSPAVRQGDSRWRDIVSWVHFALVLAEEHGVTQANVEEMRSSENPDIRRLLGVEGNFGEALGLRNDWGFQIIRHIGNYGEVFERTLTKSLGIERGVNSLWKKGGLQYAPPLR